MSKQNHNSELRKHLFDTFSLGRYVIPSSLNIKFKAPEFYATKFDVSRTSCLVQAISRAAKQVPECNASFIRNPWTNSSRIVHFDQVCATVSIDKTYNGERYPFGLVIPNSDELTLSEIDKKIKYAVKNRVEDIPEFMSLIKFLKIPRFIRKIFLRQMICNEELFKQKIGTLNVSNLTMVRHLMGGAMPAPRLVVDFNLEKATDEIVLGYNINHAITDGAQIAKFNNILIKTLKKCKFD